MKPNIYEIINNLLNEIYVDSYENIINYTFLTDTHVIFDKYYDISIIDKKLVVYNLKTWQKKSYEIDIKYFKLRSYLEPLRIEKIADYLARGATYSLSILYDDKLNFMNLAINENNECVVSNRRFEFWHMGNKWGVKTPCDNIEVVSDLKIAPILIWQRILVLKLYGRVKDNRVW